MPFPEETFDKHPLVFLQNLIESKNLFHAYFFFSVYECRAGYGEGLGDIREKRRIRVRGDDIYDLKIRMMLSDLKEGEELGLISMVEISYGRDLIPMHIPMIDFAVPNHRIDIALHRTLYNDTGYLLNRKIWVYNSGRSFHAYGQDLIENNRYINYLNYLIIADRKNSIDHQWVGHSIRNWAACLRWSKNTDHHTTYPTHLDTINPMNRGIVDVARADPLV